MQHILKKRTLLCVCLLCVALSLFSCTDKTDYYIVGTRQQKQHLQWLWDEFNSYDIDDPHALTVLELIAAQLAESGHHERLRHLLINIVQDHPDNYYNSYLVYLVAHDYHQNDEIKVAEYYYKSILHNYDDVSINERSIHYLTLVALTTIGEDPQLLTELYQTLIARFPENIDIFNAYQQIIINLRKVSEWDMLYATYRNLLTYCEEYPSQCELNYGQIQYLDSIRAELRFSESNRYWTTEDLNLLVQAIKEALAQRSTTQLLNWQSQVNFFARSWQQEEFDFNSQITFNIGIFLRRSRVQFEKNIDINSNEQEAFLRTWGWSHRIPTWFFYFRKIDFPADPEVHGNWEWAGIFFGELL